MRVRFDVYDDDAELVVDTVRIRLSESEIEGDANLVRLLRERFADLLSDAIAGKKLRCRRVAGRRPC